MYVSLLCHVLDCSELGEINVMEYTTILAHHLRFETRAHASQVILAVGILRWVVQMQFILLYQDHT
jgi:hypothetical protein